MANPYLKYFTPEDVLQREIAAFLRHYRIPILWMHPHNEGRRTPYERFRMKELGGSPGIPDILIFESRGGYHGMAVELKVTGYPTEHQTKWLADMQAKGWRAEIIKNKDIGKAYEEFCELLNSYMAGKIVKEGWR
jgi:hypothetical protein